MKSPLVFGDQSVASGTRQTVSLPVARLYTHTPLTMTFEVINGREDGPCLFVSAAIHGDELNGVVIIRRLLRKKELTRLKGALIAVPVVNLFGFLNQSRYLPDRRDLNRAFPGSKTGSLASQLAHLFTEQIVEKSTYGIDLHTGSNYRSNLPQIRAQLDDEETARIARVFGAPVLINSNLRDGSLRQSVLEHNIPMLLYESGEALRLDEISIRVGVNGVMRVMREIGMLPKRARSKPSYEPFLARTSRWVRAPMSGMFRTRQKLGGIVKKGERLGSVVDPFGTEDNVVYAPVDGLIIGMLNNPLVHRGDAIIHLACSDDIGVAEVVLESFEDDYSINHE
jgi:predicted deacylase